MNEFGCVSEGKGFPADNFLLMSKKTIGSDVEEDDNLSDMQSDLYDRHPLIHDLVNRVSIREVHIGRKYDV